MRDDRRSPSLPTLEPRRPWLIEQAPWTREHQGSPSLPTLMPGQLWLIEQAPATALCALDRGAVTSANVVIYGLTLAGVVADVLPLGAYAEPLSFPAQASGSPISPRTLQFLAASCSG